MWSGDLGLAAYRGTYIRPRGRTARDQSIHLRTSFCLPCLLCLLPPLPQSRHERGTSSPLPTASSNPPPRSRCDMHRCGCARGRCRGLSTRQGRWWRRPGGMPRLRSRNGTCICRRCHRIRVRCTHLGTLRPGRRAHPRSALRVHPRARARHLAALDAFEAGMALARAGELARNARTVHIYAHLLCEQSVLRCVTALVIDPHPSGLVDFAGGAA